MTALAIVMELLDASRGCYYFCILVLSRSRTTKDVGSLCLHARDTCASSVSQQGALIWCNFAFNASRIRTLKLLGPVDGRQGRDRLKLECARDA